MSQPPKSSESESEILVIGGGIAGVSTAYHLALAGHEVTLLERGEIASEASGVNAGHLGGLGWGRMPDLESFLTMGSLEIFKGLALDLGYDIEFRQSGSLEAVQSEGQLEYARDRVWRLRSDGFTIELLTAREARAMEPELSAHLLGAVFMPSRGQGDPIKATRAFSSAAQEKGARVLTGQRVFAIQHHDDGSYVVGTSQGRVRSRTLVLAAGAWCGPMGDMLGLRIPIVPVRGQMWATDPLPPCLFHTISSTESQAHWHHQPGNGPESPPELTHKGEQRVTRHLYGRQTKSGEIIFGGDRQMVGYESVPDPTGIESNKGHAAEVLPFLAGLPVNRTWAGLMPFSMDGKPIIGSIPQLDRLYIVSGLGSSGFGRGPMAGKLLAEHIHSGHRPPMLDPADPARCVTWAS